MEKWLKVPSEKIDNMPKIADMVLEEAPEVVLEEMLEEAPEAVLEEMLEEAPEEVL